MAKKPALKPNDLHVIVNDWESRYIGEAKCYSANGKLLWSIPALCKGVEGSRWDVRSGDTPPGLYAAETITETRSDEPAKTWNAYGRWFIDLVEQEGQESKYGRAGVGWHGGGSSLENPLALKQPLVPTLGCIRSHNVDMDKIVIPALREVRSKGGTMWVTVNQFD